MLIFAWWALGGMAAVTLRRADQACLAAPGCQSHSGILWTLLAAASLGYPVLAGGLVGLGLWARARTRGR